MDRLKEIGMVEEFSMVSLRQDVVLSIRSATSSFMESFAGLRYMKRLFTVRDSSTKYGTKVKSIQQSVAK